ncbi:MAG TPA: DUF2391 family protein [Candidatus Nanoarchaeia archaeon]|nr:DUF2391 family protein [Candidatus Nanoarchaeia archaeon]
MARKVLKKIREREDRLEREEERIEQEEKNILTQENKIEQEEAQLLEEQKKIESMTSDIEKKLTDKPLARITMRDITKGLIGAFVGVAAHFTFTYVREVAENIGYSRATLLYILSYIIGFLFIYKTGFRDVREIKFMNFLPIRVTVIYVTCIGVTLVVLFLFNLVDIHNLGLLYKQVAVTSIPAILGAGTADMIGRE